MPEERLPHLKFSQPEVPDPVPYRAISWLAMAALLLGAASALSLLSGLLAFIPLIAVGLAVAALRSIANTQPRPLGRRAALAGVALAVLFGTWSTTQGVIRQYWIYRQAQQYADQWLELVREGRVYEAHQLYLPQDRRKSPGTALSVYYESDRDARRELDQIFDVAPCKQIVEMGKRCRVRFVRNESFDSVIDYNLYIDSATMRYQVEGDLDGKPSSFPITLALHRKRVRGSDNVSWVLHHVAVAR